MRRIPKVGQVFNLPVNAGQIENLLHDRAGFSLHEMFVAVVVFGTVLMTFLPLMQSVGNQQRLTDQRLLSLREANNVLEELSRRKWSELTTDELAKLTLPDDVKSRLPQATLRIDVSQSDEQPPSKRVAVKLTWMPRSSQAAQSVQLATWFFQMEGRP
jgi:type II secretory pathway pseudopilin PulG